MFSVFFAICGVGDRRLYDVYEHPFLGRGTKPEQYFIG